MTATDQHPLGIKLGEQDAAPDEDSLKRLIGLCEKLEEQKAEVKRLDEEHKAAKKAFMKTEREDLPILFSELGIPSMTLPSGQVVSVVDDATAHISKANHNAAMKWMIENNFGGLIKTELIVEYGRGEREQAVELAKKLSGMGVSPAVSEAVHHSTLKSFVKERLSKGEDIPHDLFGIHAFTKATIKKG